MERPSYYPYHDVNEINLTEPQNSLFVFSGYPAGLPVPSSDHNGKFNSNYKWAAYLDQGTLRNDDWLSGTNVALSLSMLTYTAGTNVLTTGATVATYASYLLNNNRIEIDDAALNGIGAAILGSPLVYPDAIAPGRIWVYAATSGQVRFESVAAATPDAPGGSEITLVGIDIDASGKVLDGAVVPVTLPLPDYMLDVVIPITINDLTVDNDLAVTGDFSVGGNTTLGDAAGDTVSTSGPLMVGTTLTVTTDLAVNGNTTLGNAAGDTVTIAGPLTASGALATLGDSVNLGTEAGAKTVTIGADAADTLTCQANATFNNDVVLGSSSTDALIVPATSTFQSPINIGSSVDFGANTITGAGGTITTSTVNSSVVVPTEVRYNTGVGPSPTSNGRTGYDGRSLTLGDGSTARRFHTPQTVYVVSDTTTLAVEDVTGASITMDIGNNEWVYFRLNAGHVLSVGDTFSVLLAASNGVDNVTVLNSGDDDVASYGFTFGANQKITQILTVRWKPTNDIPVPNNTTWTIRVRHGVSGGNTLTTSNVHLEGWYEMT